MKYHNCYFRRVLMLFATIPLMIGCSARTNVPDSSVPGNGPLTLESTAQAGIGKIAFVYERNGTSSIFVMNADGSNEQNLTSNLTTALKPAWSPDGHYIAFVSIRDGAPQILLMKSDGSGQTQLTSDANGADSPAWSPDGSYIAFTSNQDGLVTEEGVPIPEVYIIKVDGTERRRVTDNRDFERDLVWSPKGDLLAVSINVRGNSGVYFPQELYLLDLNGVIQKRITGFDSNNEHPAWSPTGDLIAFSTNESSISGICTVKPDGSGKACTIRSNNTDPSLPYINNVDPAYSPDGDHIIFSSNRDGNYNLYVAQKDGSGLMRLTDMPGDELSPAWSIGP